MRIRPAKETWEAVKGALQIQINKANYETWLKDTVGLGYQGNQFIIGTPNAFAAEWLEKRLHSLVQKTLISVIGQEVEIQFQVCPRQEASAQILAATENLSPKPLGRLSPLKLNSNYTFNTFVVGDCNRLAYAAALGVAEEPGFSYNPLFIYGGYGLGKSHLVQAIGHAASENGFQVLYASTEQFTNEFINAVKERKTEEFRSKFRNVEILLLDDIQFISGKEQTQESLIHIFNELHNANHQIVISSDQPPDSIPSVDNRLRSRCQWGLTTNIQPPDSETRLAILRALAERQRVQIAEEVFTFIAQRYHRSIRQLEQSFNQVIAHSKLVGSPPTLELAERALLDIKFESITETLTPSLILRTVAEYFHLSPEELTGRKKEPQVIQARQLAIYLMREKTGCPLQSIGTLMGGRDHSTILHGYRKIAKQLETDQKLQSDLQAILSHLHTNQSST